MKETIKNLFTRKRFRITEYLNSISVRWTNTKVKFFPDHQFTPDGEKGNLIELIRLQNVDMPALCVSRKARVFKGRALTVSHVWLTDEAVIALHRVLGDHIKRRIGEETTKEWTDEELQAHIDQWPEGQEDRWLAARLNSMDLQYEQYKMAIDYYKKIGPFAKETTNE